MSADWSPAGPPRAERRPRVLVVDAYEDAASSLRLLLVHCGYEVAVARSGAEALEVVRTFHPDAVVSELVLPGLSGLHLAEQLRTALPGVLLVALTGLGRAGDRDCARRAGFDHHLVKTAEPDLLLGVLERAKDKAR